MSINLRSEQSDVSTPPFLQKAIESLLKEDSTTAERCIQEALALDPMLIDGYARLGGLYRERRNWRQAKYWMEKDHAAGRMSIGWLLRYAEVLAELEDADRAETIVTDAYQQDPHVRDGYARLGGVFMRREEWNAAHEWMRRDVEQDRISPAWLVQYAVVLAERGDLCQAESIIGRVYIDDQDITDGYARLGGVFMRRKEWNAAHEWMRRDVEQDRISPAWLVQYAVVSGHCGEFDTAISLMDVAYRNDASLSNGYARLAWIHRSRRSWANALELMNQDAILERMSLDWQLRHAELLCEYGKYLEAEKHLLNTLHCNTAQKWSEKIGIHWLKVYSCIYPCETLDQETKIAFVTTVKSDRLPQLLANLDYTTSVNRWMFEQSSLKIQTGNMHPACGTSDASIADWDQGFRLFNKVHYDRASELEFDVIKRKTLSRLLLADKCYSENNYSCASAHLMECVTYCLQSCVPSEECAEITNALLAYRNGTISKDEAEAGVNGCIVNIPSSTITNRQWLALHDVLLWYGLFIPGLKAWQNSVVQTHAEAQAYPANLKLQRNGLNAALIDADYERGQHYLRAIKELSLDDYLAAKAYMSAHQLGDKSLLAVGVHSAAFEHSAYWKLLNGRSVAIVGPAPSGEHTGHEIDQYDVVIRTCFTGRASLGDVREYGENTDVSNYSLPWLARWNAMRHDYLDLLRFYTFTMFSSVCQRLPQDMHSGKAHLLHNNQFMYYKSPMAISRIIHDALCAGPATVKVFKATFYASSNAYRTGYDLAMPLEHKPTTYENKLRSRAAVLWAHDYLSQIKYVRNLWNAGMIDVDHAGQKVLSMSDESYMKCLDTIYG